MKLLPKQITNKYPSLQGTTQSHLATASSAKDRHATLAMTIPLKGKNQ